VRLDIRRIESIKEGQDVHGSRVRVKVVKNKMAPPFKQAEFDVMFAEGISKTGELVDIGVERKIVDKSGAWFSYGAERIGQGREAAKEFLKMHPAVAREIETKIHEAAGMRPRPAASATSAEIETHGKPAAEKRSDEKRVPASRV
jgi:recombination protein RecA